MDGIRLIGSVCLLVAGGKTQTIFLKDIGKNIIYRCGTLRVPKPCAFRRLAYACVSGQSPPHFTCLVSRGLATTGQKQWTLRAPKPCALRSLSSALRRWASPLYFSFLHIPSILSSDFIEGGGDLA